VAAAHATTRGGWAWRVTSRRRNQRHVPAPRPVRTESWPDPSAAAVARGKRRARGGTDINAPANVGDIISYLREHQVTLTWDQAAAAMRADTPQAITVQAS
jgi:hypothetical protein